MEWSKQLVAILRRQTKLCSVLHTLAWCVIYKNIYIFKILLLWTEGHFKKHLSSTISEVRFENSPRIAYPLLGQQVEMTQVVYEGASFVTRPLWLIESERPGGKCFREETNRTMRMAGWMNGWTDGRQEGRLAFICRFANFYTSLCISYILC